MLYEGQILDGRNRYRALKDLGLPIKTVNYEGNGGKAFTRALNLEGRRHLTPAEKGLAIARLETLKWGERQNKNNQHTNNLLSGDRRHSAELDKPKIATRAELCEAIGVGETAVKQMKSIDAVKDTNPEILEEALKTGGGRKLKELAKTANEIKRKPLGQQES